MFLNFSQKLTIEQTAQHKNNSSINFENYCKNRRRFNYYGIKVDILN